MKPNFVLAVIMFLLFFLGGQLTAPIQRSSLQSEIQQLQQQGVTIRFLDNATVEVSDPASGINRVKTLQEPSETAIRAWAAARGVPILEIDPRTLDTTRWSGWYRYWTTVPVSNGIGIPLVVGDLDSNGRTEVYADYKDYSSDFQSVIYEVDSTGASQRMFEYQPRMGGTRQFTDVDHDGASEIVWFYFNFERGYEQPQALVMPTEFLFRAVRDSIYGSTLTGVYFGNLDGDSLTDFTAACAGFDSTLNRPYRRICVKEYRPLQQDFREVWSSGFGHRLEGGIFGGFTADDFDRDGKQEFVTCEIQGKAFVVENIANDSYREAWRDSTPFVNLFYMTSGDIDRDSRSEFYLGATMNNGNWTTMYEADSNDHYSPRLIFHLLSGGTLDSPTYLTPDVDHDGRKELVILSGADLYVFKSDANDSFYLWYFKRFTSRQSIQFYDFNYDGKEDIILNLAHVDSLGRGTLFSEIYLAQRLTAVAPNKNRHPLNFSLTTNFPNPFNPATKILYFMSESADVRLEVLDIVGRVVIVLFDGNQSSGEHEVVWNGKNEKGNNVASGVYLCHLVTGKLSRTIKMLLLR
jgi:hypothetical protein